VARVTTKALRVAGPAPPPVRLAQALRGPRMDLGGYSIDFMKNICLGRSQGRANTSSLPRIF
jgi:hypothetical protein